MLRTLLISAAVLLAGANAQCINDPVAYGAKLDAIVEGSAVYDPATDCVDEELMISIQGSKDGNFPDTINKYKSFWAWASTYDNMEKYLEMASRHVGDRAGLASEMTLYVGIPGPLDTAETWTTVVFRRSLMSGYLDPINPTWDNLFNYLADFDMCPPSEIQCVNEKIPFADAVMTDLMNEDVVDITGCPGQLDLDSCSCLPDFCEMQGELVKARKDGTQACVERFTSEAGALDNVAKSRAFFDVCVGCNELFTGNGHGSNGQEQTGLEYLVRGDVLLSNLGADRYYLYTPA